LKPARQATNGGKAERRQKKRHMLPGIFPAGKLYHNERHDETE
jgi:hypothetical protein